MIDENTIFPNDSLNNEVFSGQRRGFDLEKEFSQNNSSENHDKTWKVLVVDDEVDIHSVIKISLNNLSYKNTPLQIYHAYSASEARKVLNQVPDISLVLLDVVMESNHAGLEFVHFIRNEVKNPLIRIVIWTGQAGLAPERDVIISYEINDYRSKTELTSDKLVTVVLAGLRSYEALITLESFRKDLELKVAERTEELEFQKSELQKVNKAKDKFFSIIAHDLKNPFNSIIGYSNLLLSGFDNLSYERKTEILKIINQTSVNTHSLFENLLQWARSQTNGITYNPEDIDLAQVVDENIDLLMGNASEKNISLVSELLPLMVFADKNMINTVIRNLLTNAIKFTPSNGEIKFIAKETLNYIELCVCDSGVGMTEEEINKLFKIEQFHSTIGTANEKGTGLGLIVCREFIIKNKGEIRVESIPGKGSNFFITIPLTQN